MIESKLSYSGKGAEGEFSGEVIIRLPETLEEARQAHGDDVVLASHIRELKRAYGRIARSFGSDTEAAQQACDAYVPGVSRTPRASTGKVSKRKIMEALKNLPPERLEELLGRLKAEVQSEGSDPA